VKHCLKPSQKEVIIKAITSYLVLERKEIAVAYLFGSFITADSFSDIDLGLLAQTEIPRPLTFELKLEKEIEKFIKYQVDIRVLNGAPISFCQNVIRCGRVILDRDPNLRADFEGKALKQYFDFSPFRRQYLTEVINAPV